MAIKPIQFSHQGYDEYIPCLFFTFPLSDLELAERTRMLLEQLSSIDVPLVKGPFVSRLDPRVDVLVISQLTSECAAKKKGCEYFLIYNHYCSHFWQPELSPKLTSIVVTFGKAFKTMLSPFSSGEAVLAYVEEPNVYNWTARQRNRHLIRRNSLMNNVFWEDLS